MGTHRAGLRTRNQIQRRKRIVNAAAALASRGGIDAMQMRTVAARAGVALGTLYRYFPSKMDLVVAVIGEELEALEAALQRRPPTASTTAGRAAEVLLRATHGLMREPELADALVRSVVFSSEEVETDFADRVSRLLLRTALETQPDGELEPNQLALGRLLQSIWISELLGLIQGKRTMEDAQWHLELGAERLLHDL